MTLVYFWLNSSELAIQRVAQRVKEGGHNIPAEVITRRYDNGIKNLVNLFIPLVDFWLIIDNSSSPFHVIAEGKKGENAIVHQRLIWKQITS